MGKAKIISDIAWAALAILLATFLTVAFDLYERVNLLHARP